LEGWAPDFLIKTPHGDVLVEVKPTDPNVRGHWEFEKAFRYWNKYQVLLLGREPRSYGETLAIGTLLDNPLDTPSGSQNYWSDFLHFFCVDAVERRWREAGNLTQWQPR
jgi:hypothetical protein